MEAPDHVRTGMVYTAVRDGIAAAAKATPGLLDEIEEDLFGSD
jgi:hypothetical protein